MFLRAPARADTGEQIAPSADAGHDRTGQRPAWRVLLGYAHPHRWVLATGGLLGLLTGATGLALPLAARALVGDLAGHRTVRGVLLLMMGLVLANAGTGALGSYLLRRTAESVVLAARQRLISRLTTLRVSAVDRYEPGDLMARITSDTTLLRDVTTESLVGAVTGSLTLLATLTLMGLLDPVLLVVTLAALTFAGLVLGLLVPRIRQAAGRAQESVGAMGIGLERMFGAFRTIKTCGAESREGLRINEAATAAWRADVRAAKWQSLAGNIAGLAIQAAFLVVLGVGGARVASGAITVGTLIAFLLYLYYLLPPIQQLVSCASEYQIGTVAVARISEAERLPVELVGTSDGHQGWSSEPTSLALEQVRFRYRPDLPEVLQGVSLSVPPRGMTALVGLSGAGKTTIFSLIERLYDTDSGRITLDEVDVRDWPIATLRATIGYVEQDAPVLSGTLRENLVLGAPGADEETLWEVLRTTRLSTLVDGLPAGLATQVGHRGTRLSGGERQRVAIARALLRNPRLLLLDEATSQLDAINEAALRDTLTEVARTTTVLVVAHRLSTVTMADRIVVLDEGQVRAIGTHAELLGSDQLYADLAATQFLSGNGRQK